MGGVLAQIERLDHSPKVADIRQGLPDLHWLKGDTHRRHVGCAPILEMRLCWQAHSPLQKTTPAQRAGGCALNRVILRVVDRWRGLVGRRGRRASVCQRQALFHKGEDFPGCAVRVMCLAWREMAFLAAHRCFRQGWPLAARFAPESEGAAVQALAASHPRRWAEA